MELISPNLYRYNDTCHVYVVRSGDMAVLVDFGDGAVLDALPSIGVSHVSDILFTHHHRDQAQGLPRALANHPACLADTRVWVPYIEQDLFHDINRHWETRPLLNSYDVRQDRYSLLEPVPVDGVLSDYHTYSLGGRDWLVIPTPGHTPGSLSLLVTVDARRLAFTGDLIAGPGKIWSMAALQWTYHTMGGAAASIASLMDLASRSADVILPSHGEIMPQPGSAIDTLVQRLYRLLDACGENTRLREWLDKPYEAITPHLLRNRTSVSNSYVLLSESGKALFIDYGYDLLTCMVFDPDHTWHRPWLYTIPALKRDFGVQTIDAVIATHYHDDHVAGMNLLRDMEGTQVWAAENFTVILENPNGYDLPCLWYDPIHVDKVMPLGEPVTWEEYHITAYALPGHTRYAAAIFFEVDGKRILATGDQYQGNAGLDWNFIYQNRFSYADYTISANLYRQLSPDIILPGHWDQLWVTDDYLECLSEKGELLSRLHRDLLPFDTLDLGAEGFAVRITPYHWLGVGGDSIDYTVEVSNPLPQAATARLRLILPAGWQSPVGEQLVFLQGGEAVRRSFMVTPPANAVGPRFRLAVDLTVGDVHLGQQAEALVDLAPSHEGK